jgi:hypothetical protein
VASQPRIVWGDEITENADDLMYKERDRAADKKEQKDGKLFLAKAFLQTNLKDGGKKASDMFDKALREEGLNEYVMRKALTGQCCGEMQ